MYILGREERDGRHLYEELILFLWQTEARERGYCAFHWFPGLRAQFYAINLHLRVSGRMLTDLASPQVTILQQPVMEVVAKATIRLISFRVIAEGPSLTQLF